MLWAQKKPYYRVGVDRLGKGVFSTVILWIAKNHAPVKQMKNAALKALDRSLIPTYKNL